MFKFIRNKVRSKISCEFFKHEAKGGMNFKVETGNPVFS